MTTGRPGPVVLDVPFDVFMEVGCRGGAERESLERQYLGAAAAPIPEGVVKAVDMLLSAERPVMIVGQGVR